MRKPYWLVGLWTATGVLGAAVACDVSQNTPGAAGNEAGAGSSGQSGGSSSPGGGPSVPGGGSSNAGGAGRSADADPDAWREGLQEGPNGPIPVLVVDQFGYRPADPKFALVRDPRMGFDAAVDFSPGATYALVNAQSGVTVKEGAPVPWNGGAVDSLSGDAVWTFDFSDVTTPGSYYVLDVEHHLRSPGFEIAADVYRQVLRHALRTFFYQRAGFEKTAATAGADWADGASHLKSGQDAETRSWLDKSDASKAKDLHAGWFDAGDYNKYTSWHARYIITLLRSFARYPQAFTDDSGIPESGNGTPDLLDEVKFGLDWLVRMQNEDGSVLCIQGLSDGSPPSSASGASYYGPPTTSATLASAAAFAYAARVFGARAESGFKELAADYLGRAIKAWQFAAANPAVIYFNNDESKQPGSQGLGAGQQEIDDAGRLAWKVEAAAYLFERTAEPAYRDFFDQNYSSTVPSYGLSHWEVERHEAALDYASQSGATPAVASAIVAKFTEQLNAVDGLAQAAITHTDAYRAPISQYTWGSNQSKSAVGRLLLLASEYGIPAASTEASRVAALDEMHYLHGANPLGLVYLSNMKGVGAEHSVKTFYHSWFSYKSARWSEVTVSTPGPAPGFLVGGPNPSYSVDNCCTDGSKCSGSSDFKFCSMDQSPPVGQPPAKSYRQFNLGWPANSWAVTENSNGYQVQYIRALAAFVE